MSRATGAPAGQVAAFVVSIVAALLLLAGLVVDGGLVLAAKRRASNQAEAAARAGAQAVAVGDYRVTGQLRLDPPRAAAAAHGYLTAAGSPGQVQVGSDRVTVTVHLTQPLQVLSLAGLGPVTVTGRGTARAARGVERAEP